MPRKRRDPLKNLLQGIVPIIGLGAFLALAQPDLRPKLLAVGVGGLAILLIALGVTLWVIRRRKRSPQLKSVAPPPIPVPTWKAVSPPALPTIRPTAFTPEALRMLDWKRFEDLVAAFARETGHDARTTRIGPDGGVDVEVLDPQSGRVVQLVQCKAWDQQKVGIKPIRELFGVMAAKGISEGAYFSTSGFSEEAASFGTEHNLDLVDSAALISRIHEMPPDAQQRLLHAAFDGDFATPTCPSCGTKMVERSTRSGPEAGATFWGCAAFPHCRRTFRSRRAA